LADAPPSGGDYIERMQIQGKFELQSHFEPPFDEVEGVSLGRATFSKRFEGPLTATSQVHMLAARTPTDGSGAYVAIERIRGSVSGKQGTFVVVQTGIMTLSTPSLTISIVPGSGTGELEGIAGSMDIQIVEGHHYYTLNYTLP
jgi:hypothetical protein